MKTLNTLFIIFLSINCYSQDPRLFEHTWYLHDLIINGDSNVPPVNDEIEYVPLNFEKASSTLGTGVCAGGGGELSFNGMTEFSFESIVFLATGCNTNFPQNPDYDLLYKDFWWDGEQDPFQYEIIEIDDTRTLIITSILGDQAIYGNNVLSLSEFSKDFIQIQPNPTTKYINISLSADIILKNISVFDLSGRKVLKIINNKRRIDVNDLSNGIYILSLTDTSGKTVNTKFVKTE